MSTAYVVTEPPIRPDKKTLPIIVTWTLANGESGDLFCCAGYSDRSIHVYGTIGGATVTMKGANVNDATKAVTVKDFDATDITFTAAGINSVRDNIAYIQPVLSGGSGSTITIAMLME